MPKNNRIINNQAISQAISPYTKSNNSRNVNYIGQSSLLPKYRHANKLKIKDDLVKGNAYIFKTTTNNSIQSIDHDSPLVGSMSIKSQIINRPQVPPPGGPLPYSYKSNAAALGGLQKIQHIQS